MRIDARHILTLLGARHTRDVFVPECKDGPTWDGRPLRMDAWAMRRSWTRPLIRAYEIKVTRPDFMRDTKWPGYLDCCNEFYFVAPAGLIDPGELGEDVGLLCVSKTGTRLFTKKRARYRDVTIPECLYQYVLMSRAKIVPPEGAWMRSAEDLDYWREWLTLKDESKEVGRQVAGRLGRLYTEQVSDVRAKQETLEHRLRKYEAVAALCESLGVSPDGWNPVDDARRRLAALTVAVPPELRGVLRAAREALAKLDEALNQIPECQEAAQCRPS